MKSISWKAINLKWVILGILSFVVLLVLADCIFRAGFIFSIDYNEGWNAFFTQRILDGEKLYTHNSQYITNNYPPFSFYINAFISGIFGNVLISGRFISVFSVILISVIVVLIIRKQHGNIYESVFSGVFCLAVFSILAHNYVGMFDPQLLGNLFAALALLFYLNNNKKLLLIAILITISVFIKHSLIILPFAITLDIFFNHSKLIFKYVACMILCIGIVVLALLMFEKQFLIQILSLESSRGFSVFKAFAGSYNELIYIQIPIVCGLLVLYLLIKKSASKTIIIYLIASLCIGAYFHGGDGVTVNVFFDLFIALSISTGFVLIHLRNKISKGELPGIFNWIIPLMLSFGLLVESPLMIIRPDIYSGYAKKEKEFYCSSEIIRSIQDPVISEDILICYLADKEFCFDAFNVSQLIQSGAMDEKDMIQIIEEGAFPVIILANKIEFDSTDLTYGKIEFSGRFSDNTLKAIFKYYKLIDSSSAGFIYEYVDPKKLIKS